MEKEIKEKIIRIRKMLDNRYSAGYNGISQFGKTPIEAEMNLITLLKKMKEAELLIKPDPIIFKPYAET